MRILLTADPELPVPPQLYGGIERIIDLLVTNLRSRGHAIGLVAHRQSASACDHLFPWPGLQSQQKMDVLRNTQALWRAVKTFQPDVVHSFSRVAYLLPLMSSVIPKIMSYQRFPSPRTVRWGAKLGRRSLTFTGCSEYICRSGRAAGGVWHAIHNCVELEKYTFQPEVSDDAPLVFLSRIERIKGAHNAIAVAKRTRRRLLIAGNHSISGEEGRYWRQEITPYLGRDGIEYVGPVNDEQKNQLLGQAAAMIVPIEWDEPFGIVFAEALACGTPVISCPRGALPEIVRNGVDGFLINNRNRTTKQAYGTGSVGDLVPVKAPMDQAAGRSRSAYRNEAQTDVDGLNLDEACAAVEKLSQIDRSVCRERAETCFSSQVIVDRYERLYRSLIQNSGPVYGGKENVVA